MEPDLLQEYVHEDMHQRHEYRLTLRRVRLILVHHGAKLFAKP